MSHIINPSKIVQAQYERTGQRRSNDLVLLVQVLDRMEDNLTKSIVMLQAVQRNLSSNQSYKSQ